jgi:hypothetical protein
MSQLLREFYALCDGGVCQDFLTEQEKVFVKTGGMILTGMIQHADKENGNGRVYPRKILEREMERYQALIKDNRATGELDHPDSSVINLKNVSHLVTECWWEGDAVMGKIKILSTPSGQILRNLVNDGIKLGISSRGLGSTHTKNGKIVVEEDFQLICFDMVSEPSTPNAFMFPKQGLQESVQKLDKLNRLMIEITRK